MKLIKLKLRGLGATPVTQWCDLAQGMNLFNIPDNAARIGFVEATQTINPPYDCKSLKLFADFPTSLARNGYTRYIQPHKRTIAIGVFSTTPDLVEILTAISPHFYEMDRLEVGRRLDYSRWLNYVELASSTRWAEVSEEMWSLFRKCGNDDPQIYNLLQGLLPTDRVTGEVMSQLTDWLESLCSRMAAGEKECYFELLATLKRAELFAQAKTVTEGYLPYMFTIDLSQPVPPSYQLDDQNPLSFLLRTASQKSRRSADSVKPDIEQAVKECNRVLELYAAGVQIRVKAGGNTCRVIVSGKTWAPSSTTVFPDDLVRFVTIITALHRAQFNTWPILLFHDGNSSGQTLHTLYPTLLELSANCQCLYFPLDPSCADGFPGARTHDWEKLVVGAGDPD